MMGLLTGHCHLKGHPFKLELTHSPGCNRFKQASETASHILCYCKVLAILRLRHICQHFKKQDDLQNISISRIHSMACAECDDSLPFSGASSIPLCCVLFSSTQFHQLVFHSSLLCLAIYFSVYLSALLFPNSYLKLFWEFYFLPFSVYAQTNVMYLALF